MTITGIICNELIKHYNETIHIKSPKENEEWDGEKYTQKDVIGTLTHVGSYTYGNGTICVFAKVSDGRISRMYEITNTEFEFI